MKFANLNIYYYGYGGSGGSWVNRPVRTYRLKKNWLQSQATRDKATSSVNWTGQWAEGDYVTTHTAEYTFTLGTYGWKEFDIKSMVEKWVSKPDSNFGVISKATNENTDGCDVRMRSSEYTDTNYRPYLEVTYSGILARNYYLKDHLGDIRVTIDENGAVLGYNDYYPFGLQMNQRCLNNSISDDIYKYSGKELDEENGLNWYYFGARYYDPEIGRFLSIDPNSYKYPSWTPYNYCFNNPLLFIDPYGMDGVKSTTVEEIISETYDSGIVKTEKTTTTTISEMNPETGKVETKPPETTSEVTITDAAGNVIYQEYTDSKGKTTVSDVGGTGGVIDFGEIKSITVIQNKSLEFNSGDSWKGSEINSTSIDKNGNIDTKPTIVNSQDIPRPGMNKKDGGFINTLKKIINPGPAKGCTDVTTVRN